MRNNIYLLCEPDGTPRYIGKTTYELGKRLGEHVSEARKAPIRTTHKNNWIRKLLSNGQRPTIQLIEECSGDGNDEECFWIFVAKNYSTLRLVNATDGGDGGSMTPEQKAVLGERMKGNKYSVGVKHTEETRKKLSEIRRGKKMPPRSLEYREKQRLAKLGKPSEKKGKPLPLEQVEKMKAAWTPEKRDKYRDQGRVTGRLAKRTEDGNRRIGEATRERWKRWREARATVKEPNGSASTSTSRHTQSSLKQAETSA